MNITIQIASVPDRENLVAELWYNNEQWGEVSQENGVTKLEIYPRFGENSSNVWSFDLSEVMAKLQEAQRNLH
jgi:hypothetical protein